MHKNFKILISTLVVFVFILIIINLNIGFIKLQFSDFFSADSVNHQIAELRINRILGMLLAGISIPTAGFLLQEYFQNPIAGPEVLGISSVGSLAVAFYIFLFSSFPLPDFLQNSFISISAISGSVLLMLILLLFSRKFQDKTYLIVFGFLVSAFTGALISIMQLYTENQNLKNYLLWSFGANNQASRNQIYVLGIFVLIGVFFCFRTIKPLIGSAFGTQYAQSLGVNLKHLKVLIIITSSILSASVTAFIGPILFIGIVVPHFCRMLWNPSQLWHQWILNMLIGIISMEFFSIFSEILKLPINIMTSILGIPIVFMMLLKKKA